MMGRYAAAFSVLTGILAMFCAAPAFAGGPSCVAVVVQAADPVSARWSGLPAEVREAFEARDDIDRCARVQLTLGSGPAVTMEVTLPDGRSAIRTVTRRDDVLPTLEALLLVPQDSEPPQTPALEPPEVAPSPAGPVAGGTSAPPPGTPAAGTPRIPSGSTLAAPDRDTASPGDPPGHLRIELSLVTGARLGDGQAGVGLGAFSLLDLSGWLLGFEGRADHYTALSGATPSASVLELAVLGGRRFRFRSLALDLVAGLAGVLQGTTTFSRAVPAPDASGGAGADPGASSSSSSGAAPRLLLGARVNFSARSTLHTFVGIDGELGAPRAGNDDLPEVPRLPLWTLGLALGATVGTR
jgi:hypothetical protein